MEGGKGKKEGRREGSREGGEAREKEDCKRKKKKQKQIENAGLLVWTALNCTCEYVL